MEWRLADPLLDPVDGLAQQLLESAKGNFDAARTAAEDALMEVERLVVNHAEAL